MTLAQLIALFRQEANDAIEPFLFPDAAVTGWLNEAEDEAAVRSLLLPDWSTPNVCSIAVTAGTSTYSVHPSVINITRAAFTPAGGESSCLYQTDVFSLDKKCSQWRTESDEPSNFIHTDTQIRLDRLPASDGVLALEVNRTPLVAMASSGDTPEIASRHHRYLIQWALFRAFSVPDSETIDAARAAKAELEFIKMFGIRLDATIQRSSETSLPHHNASHWLG
jgi:hypothetical protein